MKKLGTVLENSSNIMSNDIDSIISSLGKDGEYAIINNNATDYFSPTDSFKKANCTYVDGTYYDNNGNELSSKGLPIVHILNGEKKIQEKLIFTSDLGTFYFYLNGSPVYDSEGKLLMGISCSLNVYEEDKTNKNLIYPINILEIVNDAIMSFDQDLKLTYMNPAAETIYGWIATDAIGKTLDEVLQLTLADENKLDIQSQYNLLNIPITEYLHHRKDGSYIWVETSSKAYYDKFGNQLGYVVVGHDITAQKEAKRITKYVKDRLDQELALKDHFQTVCQQSSGDGRIVNVLDEIIHTAIKFTNADACCIHLLDDKSENISDMAHYGFDQVSLNFLSNFNNLSKVKYQVQQEKKRILVQDISQSPLFMNLDIANITMFRSRVIQFTPLISRSGQFFGIMTTLHKQYHYLEDCDNILLDMLARLSLEIIEHLNCKINKELLIKTEREKNEALMKSIQMKDEFLAIISHEFKTPLTVINSAIQALELLCKEELSPKALEFISKIRQNSYRQLRLVNNLLDITRINSGQMKINQTNEDIIFLTKSITNSVRIYAQQRGIKLEFTSTIKQKVIGIDEEKYERILLNLLSNAIKFTPKGKHINVAISQKIVDKKSMVLIQVKDNGIGIPNDKMDLIFERFGQVDNSLTRQAEGTGIGLSLVKMLVESQNGSITLDSKEGYGSTFTIMFPAKKIKMKKDEHLKSKIYDGRLIQSIAVEFSDIYI